MPRAGTTLLCNILNQNPRFHASETSALPRIITEVRAGWENVVENLAVPKLDVKGNVMRSIVDGYYLHQDKEVIFDKSRVWLQEFYLAKFLFGEDVHFIICVRDLTEILASFEKLYRKNAAIWDHTDKKNYPEESATLTGRCELLASHRGPVGSVLQSLSEFLNIMPPDSYRLVEFDELTKYPEEEISKIYKLIGEEPYDHDFDNVSTENSENDMHYGILDLHIVRNEVKPLHKYAKDVLGVLYSRYAGGEFWRNIK